MKKLLIIAIPLLFVLAAVADLHHASPEFIQQSFTAQVGNLSNTTILIPTRDLDCQIGGYIENISLDINGADAYVLFSDAHGARSADIASANSNNRPLWPVLVIHAISGIPVQVNVQLNGLNMNQEYNFHFTALCQ